MHPCTGEGRVHTCLQEHRDELSPACRREEIKLMVRQAANVEFVPSISKTCREEMNVFCKVCGARGASLQHVYWSTV